MYPLSILATHEDYLPWFYSNYIQLYHWQGGEIKFYVHPFTYSPHMRDAYFSTCPWLDTQVLDQQIVTRMHQDIAPFILDCIDRDCYVQLDVDYFYIPDRAEYHNRHFLHEVLISGYDTQEEIFEITGFNQRGSYATSPIKFTELEQALSTPPERFMDNMADRPKAILYKYMEGERYDFDLEPVIEQLKDYLYSKDTSARFRMLANPIDVPVMWGMKVYEYLIKSCESLINSPNAVDFPVIPLRIVWEHKKSMLARIRYMEDCGYLKPSHPFSKNYAVVEKEVNSMRLIMLRWMSTRRASSLKKIVEMLRETAEAEYQVLESMVDTL